MATRTEVNTKAAPGAIGPYSQAIVSGNLVFCSGQIPLKPDGQLISEEISEQTHQVMRNLEAVLKEAGSGLDKVIKTGIFLQDMGDFGTVNEIYGSYFQAPFPARATVEVSKLPKNVRVEIEAIAQV